jgi:hypothetical protein
VAFHVVIKQLIISQHDDSYTTLDKMKHLLVGHYVRDDAQSPQCSSLHQDASPKTLSSLQQILSFKLDTKMVIVFLNYIYNYLVITITK